MVVAVVLLILTSESGHSNDFLVPALILSLFFLALALTIADLLLNHKKGKSRAEA